MAGLVRMNTLFFSSALSGSTPGTGNYARLLIRARFPMGFVLRQNSGESLLLRSQKFAQLPKYRDQFAGSFSADTCLHISKISCMAVCLSIQQISSGQASLPMRLSARLSGMKLALLSRLCVTSRTWDGLDLFDC
jgi:hypothetical protein